MDGLKEHNVFYKNGGYSKSAPNLIQLSKDHVWIAYMMIWTVYDSLRYLQCSAYREYIHKDIDLKEDIVFYKKVLLPETFPPTNMHHISIDGIKIMSEV